MTDMTWEVLKTIGNSLIIVLVIVWIASLFSTDDTDKSGWKRSGMQLYTDHKTGCQYLSGGLFGGITPRVDENGKHICEKNQ